MSQEDLAHKWGKKQYQISEHENGKRRIYAHDLPQLAQVLQVPISYFFQDDAETSESNLQEDILIQAFRNLRSSAARKFAIKVLSELRNMLDEGID